MAARPRSFRAIDNQLERTRGDQSTHEDCEHPVDGSDCSDFIAAGGAYPCPCHTGFGPGYIGKLHPLQASATSVSNYAITGTVYLTDAGTEPSFRIKTR